MKKIILLFIISIYTTFSLFSSSFKLKDGSTITGNIILETEDSITLSITIPKSQIISNEYGTVTQPNPIFEKPEKKQPVVPGNFEITQGIAVNAPIDTNRLVSAIKKALLKHNYKLVSEKPGIITFMLWKNDWDLTMNFCYAEDEYWYEYVSSRNLGADPSKNKIHRNFPKWIKTLEQELTKFY